MNEKTTVDKLRIGALLPEAWALSKRIRWLVLGRIFLLILVGIPVALLLGVLFNDSYLNDTNLFIYLIKRIVFSFLALQILWVPASLRAYELTKGANDLLKLRNTSFAKFTFLKLFVVYSVIFVALIFTVSFLLEFVWDFLISKHILNHVGILMLLFLSSFPLMFLSVLFFSWAYVLLVIQKLSVEQTITILARNVCCQWKAILGTNGVVVMLMVATRYLLFAFIFGLVFSQWRFGQIEADPALIGLTLLGILLSLVLFPLLLAWFYALNIILLKAFGLDSTVKK